MMTNTNSGSVNLRDSAYASAVPPPATSAIAMIRMMAQKPNTTSPSPSRWNSPAWRG